jgi:chromosome segregation ATPase
MFNNDTSADTKIAVLEERLSSYELMMRRIDEAIQLMGKTSQNISKMLAVHEEKIEQCNRSDDFIARTIEELRLENRDQHLEVEKRINELESKIDDIAKFRWILIGAALIVSFFVSNSGVIVDVLTPDPQSVKIERTR